ncbi:histidine kinase N-terminal 7TM domain-containing protein, partial [Armatimonas sp.]|uniref:histidine kinase N-terminal 7TM domain-containing protein n=1 Tax=Armatimonas sp. TaxID=1872638 RepID=UPI00286D37D3
MFLSPLALLYYVSFSLLAGLAMFVLAHRPRSRLSRLFFLLALSLLLWKLTLFVEVRVISPVAQLWLGRANFAVVAMAAYLALRFVQEVIQKEARASVLLLVETILLTGLTLLTPLVSVSERVEAGQAITSYGPLFGFYLTHVLGCLVAALVLAFWERCRGRDRVKRAQLTFLGIGMLATGGVSTVTNVLL